MSTIDDEERICHLDQLARRDCHLPTRITANEGNEPMIPSNGCSHEDRRLSVAFLLNPDQSAIPSPAASSQCGAKRKIGEALAQQNTTILDGSCKKKRNHQSCTDPRQEQIENESHSCLSGNDGSDTAHTQLAIHNNLSTSSQLHTQMQRQLNAQQHTQLVLKQWNKQQQIQKLKYLQQKKQTQDRPTTINTAVLHSISALSTHTQPKLLMPLIETLLQNANVVPPCQSNASSKINGNRKNEKRRKRITPEQLYVLEQVFALEPFPSPKIKELLSQKLSMSERSVTIWFQVSFVFEEPLLGDVT